MFIFQVVYSDFSRRPGFLFGSGEKGNVRQQPRVSVNRTLEKKKFYIPFRLFPILSLRE